MADKRTLKVGDTFPDLMLTAEDVAGLLPVAEADKIEFFAKSGATTITGTLEVLEPPVEDAEGEKRNLRYKLAGGDTSVSGTYALEVKITWDEASTPDSIQHVPNSGTIPLVVEPSLG